MKTSFTKLFAMIAVAVALAGGLFSSPAKAQGLIGQILHELLHDHDGHHGHGHSGHSFNGGHNFNGGGFINQQPVVQNNLPQWLVGTWTLNDGRMGGKTEMMIGNGTVTTIDYSFSQFGLREVSRTSRSASLGQNGLRVGSKIFQVTRNAPGDITLSGNGQLLNLVRAGQQPINNGGGVVINNGGQINNGGNNGGNNGQIIQISSLTNRLPVAMQGTWYEVSLNSRGEQILNRYDLGANGSYEMFQYAISADGEVDLNAPLARLSQVAAAQRRTVKFTNGVLSLGAGQTFAEGPYNATVNGSTLTLTDSTETRTWTRNP
jgi:hypothetical protein